MTTKIEKEKINEALSAIERKGRLTPEEVVREAEDPGSPLHECFEWNDSKAGKEWRLEQARTLIRSVKVEVTVNSKVVRSVCYVRDPAAEDGEQGYVSIERLRTEPENARAMILHEITMTEAYWARVRKLSEVVGVRKEVRQVERKVKAIREKVEEAVLV